LPQSSAFLGAPTLLTTGDSRQTDGSCHKPNVTSPKSWSWIHIRIRINTKN